MGIVDEDIGRVRDQSDIVAVVSQYTQLRKVGTRFSGLCPFHAEKSPSFSVNGEEGLYYCFGCGVGGDTITFVQEKEQLDFVGAVELLAAKANISLRYTEAGAGEERRHKAKLQDAVAKAADFYHDRLLTSSDAGPARSYLRKRGFDADQVRRFKVGWAPDRWDDLARHLRLSDKDLGDSGLGFVNRRGRQQDFFRGRIMFPVFDAQGGAVGFGGRKMPGDDGPKYKNTGESAVYAKSRILYGLNWAKTSVVEADEVVVCEGYTDVVGFAKAGLERAVATCGTSLTDEHAKLLSRFARRVVLAFDADAAGQNAAAKFYQWERDHNLDVAVADLPDGVDPGDLAESDPERLLAAVSGARPFLEFRLERVLTGADLDSAEGRARAAEEALEMIREHPSDIVRDQYAMVVASRCRLNEDLVRSKLARQEAPRAARPSAAAKASARERPDAAVMLREGPELEALRVAVHRLDEIEGLLDVSLFEDEVAADVFALLVKHRSMHAVIEHGGPELTDALHRLSVEESPASALEVSALLWRPFIDRELAAASLTTASVESLREIADQQTWLRSKADALSDPGRQAGAIEELLGWVRDNPKERR